MPTNSASYLKAFAVCLVLAAVAAGDETQQPDAAARRIVAQLVDADFERVTESFDPTMKKVLKPDQLQAAWQATVGAMGPFRSIVETQESKVAKLDVVLVTCQFERGRIVTRIAFTPTHEVTGLFFLPADSYRSPPYVDPARFVASDVTVGKGFLPLPGTLNLPNGEDPLPAVVLVHGSGPADRDESVGPNKPFRDLADGLATRGIAVLRYEKRTRHYKLAMALQANRITVQEEVLDDVAVAIDLLAAHPRIDPQRIFVVGHSLGGTLLPRIAAANGKKVAGYVSLAGSTRRLEDLILTQTQYLLSLAEKPNADSQKQLEEIAKQVELAKSPELTVDVPAAKLPLGIPAAYWLDLRDYSPADAAQNMPGPLLFLQGERDYQVTLEDFSQWKTALAKRNDVTFKIYPALNHLFLKGTGKANPAEYFVPGNVAEEVVRDVADWIKTSKAEPFPHGNPTR